MYKVMLVEDEIPIRNIISKMIDWHQLGFELVHQADDGNQALDYLEDHYVDLVVTDISMPFMDGLELCRRIKKFHPSVTLIILTGHNEFDYAKQAIDLNVSTYLLKPVTKDLFNQALVDVKAKMDEHHTMQKNMNFLKSQYEKSKNLLKNKFLFNLILGYTQYYDEQTISDLDLNLDANFYHVALMNFSTTSSDSHLFNGSDHPLLEFAVLNLTKELLDSIGQDIVFVGPGNQICFIFKLSEENNDEEIGQIVYCLEDLIIQIKNILDITAIIGISDVYHKLEDLTFAYKDARIALEYKVLESSEQIIFKKNVEKKSSFAFNKAEEQLERLEYSIKVGDLENVSKIIKYLFSAVVYDDININEFRTFLLKLTIVISKAYNDLRPNDENKDFINYSIFKEVFEITDLDKLKSYYIDLCTDLSNHIQEIREDEEKNHIQLACDYINEHYDDPLLNQEQLCSKLYLSSGHFSRLFKKTTGKTFVDYLTQVRMDKAKYLLANTNQKMFEIANSIGYEDPNYFSYNFKKHVEMTPSEWRKKAGL